MNRSNRRACCGPLGPPGPHRDSTCKTHGPLRGTCREYGHGLEWDIKYQHTSVPALNTPGGGEAPIDSSIACYNRALSHYNYIYNKCTSDHRATSHGIVLCHVFTTGLYGQGPCGGLNYRLPYRYRDHSTHHPGALYALRSTRTARTVGQCIIYTRQNSKVFTALEGVYYRGHFKP